MTAKSNDGGALPRAPSAAEFDDFALRLLGYLGVAATHARQKLLADRLTTVYDAGQRVGASSRTEVVFAETGAPEPHYSGIDVVGAYVHGGEEAEADAREVPRTPEAWAESIGAQVAERGFVTTEYFAGTIRAALAQRDEAWRKAVLDERYCEYSAETKGHVCLECEALRALLARAARSDSGRPTDNEIAAQVRRDNGED